MARFPNPAQDGNKRGTPQQQYARDKNNYNQPAANVRNKKKFGCKERGPDGEWRTRPNRAGMVYVKSYKRHRNANPGDNANEKVGKTTEEEGYCRRSGWTKEKNRITKTKVTKRTKGGRVRVYQRKRMVKSRTTESSSGRTRSLTQADLPYRRRRPENRQTQGTNRRARSPAPAPAPAPASPPSAPRTFKEYYDLRKGVYRPNRNTDDYYNEFKKFLGVRGDPSRDQLDLYGDFIEHYYPDAGDYSDTDDESAPRDAVVAAADDVDDDDGDDFDLGMDSDEADELQRQENAKQQKRRNDARQLAEQMEAEARAAVDAHNQERDRQRQQAAEVVAAQLPGPEGVIGKAQRRSSRLQEQYARDLAQAKELERIEQARQAAEAKKRAAERRAARVKRLEKELAPSSKGTVQEGILGERRGGRKKR